MIQFIIKSTNKTKKFNIHVAQSIMRNIEAKQKKGHDLDKYWSLDDNSYIYKNGSFIERPKEGKSKSNKS